MTTGLMQSLLA